MGNLGNALAPLAVTAVIAFALVVVLTMKNRQMFLGLLVGGSAGLAGVQILNIHVFTFMLVLWAIFGSNRPDAQRLPRAAIVIVCAGCLAVTALTGDLVNSPTLGLQLLALSACAAAIIIFATPGDFRTMLYGLLIVTSASSAWALLQVTGVVSYDVWHLHVSSLGRPTGFYPEPDWLGMYAGIGAVLAWRLELSARWRVLLVTLNGFALALAFARAAWVAVAAAILLTGGLALIQRWRSRDAHEHRAAKKGRRAAIGVLVVAGIVAISSMPAFASDLITRLSRTLVVADNDVSAQARVQQNEGLAILAKSAPWYGHGISASGRVGVSGRLEYGVSANNVGSNWASSMWVDGSLLAVPLILLLALTALVTARSIAGQCLVLVLLSSFFSNASYQPITWLLLAICLASLGQRASVEQGHVGLMRSPASSQQKLRSYLPRLRG
jgi:O-antigen ligase